MLYDGFAYRFVEREVGRSFNVLPKARGQIETIIHGIPALVTFFGDHSNDSRAAFIPGSLL